MSLFQKENIIYTSPVLEVRMGMLEFFHRAGMVNLKIVIKLFMDNIPDYSCMYIQQNSFLLPVNCFSGLCIIPTPFSLLFENKVRATMINPVLWYKLKVWNTFLLVEASKGCRTSVCCFQSNIGWKHFLTVDFH